MNHDSGLIIGIVRKLENPNRTLTKSIFNHLTQGGDTPLYRVQLSSSTGQNKVNSQLGIFSIVNGQATIFL